LLKCWEISLRASRGAPEPEVDESSLKAGLYAGDFALVDVGFFCSTGTGLDVQVVGLHLLGRHSS
jgi:hypothetical protein